MTETNMPAAEAAVALNQNDEVQAYELAFHVLPTVAEGEVPAVFAAIKKELMDADADVTNEEAPQRFSLAYTIEKRIDDKIRRFDSAYFGWVRFTLAPEKLEKVLEEVNERPDILRTLILKLTKVEEATPFFFHEALASEKKVVEISEEELASIAAEAKKENEKDADDAESDTIEDESAS